MKQPAAIRDAAAAIIINLQLISVHWFRAIQSSIFLLNLREFCQHRNMWDEFMNTSIQSSKLADGEEKVALTLT
jgi:hypothetical protein